MSDQKPGASISRLAPGSYSQTLLYREVVEVALPNSFYEREPFVVAIREYGTVGILRVADNDHALVRRYANTTSTITITSDSPGEFFVIRWGNVR